MSGLCQVWGPRWNVDRGEAVKRLPSNHWEKNGLSLSQSIENANVQLIVHLLPRGAAPHLINITIILIMLWVSSQPPVNWWSLLRYCMLALGCEERGVGGVSCSCLLRAAGGAWQRVRAWPGRDHCDTPMEIFYNCSQARLYVLLSSYRRCAALLLCIQLSRVALLPQCFMVRLSVISRL